MTFPSGQIINTIPSEGSRQPTRSSVAYTEPHFVVVIELGRHRKRHYDGGGGWGWGEGYTAAQQSLLSPPFALEKRVGMRWGSNEPPTLVVCCSHMNSQFFSKPTHPPARHSVRSLISTRTLLRTSHQSSCFFLYSPLVPPLRPEGVRHRPLLRVVTTLHPSFSPAHHYPVV